MDADSFSQLPSGVAPTPVARFRSGSRLRSVALCAVTLALALVGLRDVLSSATGAALAALSTRFGPVQRAPLAPSGPVLAPAPATFLAPAPATAAWTRADVSAVRMQWPEAPTDPEAFYATVYDAESVASGDGLLCDAACRSLLRTQGYPVPLRAAALNSRAGTPVMGGAKDGPFTPIVKVTKKVMGDQNFKAFRADVISSHTKVIQAFVDTADTPMGCIALEKLFELADKDKSGSIDKEELANALYTLGFTHLKDEQIDKILARADGNDNCVLEYDEFVKEAPKTLKTNLVKLAKENGASLGFLS